MMSARRHRGFTLVELVVSIVISSILAGMVAMVLTAPVERHREQGRRNELVDAAEHTMSRLIIDLQHAVPNSVRIGTFANNQVLQMLEFDSVLYYQDEASPGNPPAGLNFTAPGDAFTAFGQFTAPRSPTWLVTNHEGSVGRDAYALTNITFANVPLNAWGPQPIALPAAFQFTSSAVTTNRIFAVTGPITYVCNRVTGQLRRFSGHGIGANIPASEADAQLNTPGTIAQTVATGISACAVQCTPRALSTACASTVTFGMTLTRGVAPAIDNIELLQQFAVENIP